MPPLQVFKWPTTPTKTATAEDARQADGRTADAAAILLAPGKIWHIPAEADGQDGGKKEERRSGREEGHERSLELGGEVLKELSRHLTTGDVKLGCRRGPEGNF